ncbi:hypothetical protein [Ancylobacter mangrovi]|uniref:hypothetical protein n=1 Tax=Ancylobacter mangrovi TaxID=2972472 RepID=UPI002162C842|nr:hypothetical protein [Ancylobacter mangrovi]MCS0503764.1 hypothetical protein [Ancylobacter mangrovi]
MRYAAFPVLALLMTAPVAALAQSSITVHPGPTGQPQPGGGVEINIPTVNNPNYLDYGPLPDPRGSDKSMDYMNQAGGNDPIFSGPGSDNDSDILPDNDGAYDAPIE